MVDREREGNRNRNDKKLELNSCVLAPAPLLKNENKKLTPKVFSFGVLFLLIWFNVCKRRIIFS